MHFIQISSPISSVNILDWCVELFMILLTNTYITAVLPVMLTDCQTGNANVCPPDLQAKSAAVVNKVISSYRERYYEIIARL